MKSNWPVMTLDQICLKITDGAHASPKSVDIGKPMVSVKDMTPFGMDLSNARKISFHDFEQLVKQGCQPEVGDVLIAKDGNSALDTVCVVKEKLDAVLLSSIAILRPDPKQLDSDYLRYYFSTETVIEYLKSNFISGAAIPRIVLRDFKKAEVRLPPLYIQKKIVKILNALDDKILLNFKTSETLEQIAQATFKSWFVDFDPVKAKVVGRQPEGMDDTTAAFFPDSFEDSELGMIPKGWEIKALYNTAEYVNGAAFKESNFSSDNTGLPIVKIAELKQGITATTKFTKAEMNEKYSINDGDVLYSWSGSPETSLDVFKWFRGKGWLNQHIFKLNFSNSNYKYFTYFLLKQMKFVLIEIAKQKQTTGLGHITIADMKRIQIVFPHSTVLDAFARIINPIYERESAFQKENSRLANIRDTLLPKLLLGEITISEASEREGLYDGIS